MRGLLLVWKMGKTSQVTILDDGEVGFGSTEFIVMREIEGVSDKDFIYYLAISPEFRQIAIKSMVGSSGRQRVQQSVLENLELSLPPLPTQRKIAAILSALDDKIENNRKTAEKLEEIAAAVFKSWFVDFEFPDAQGKPYKSNGGKMVESALGLIPEGWELQCINNFVDYYIGGDWGKDESTEDFDYEVLCIRGADFPNIYGGNPIEIPKRFLKPSSVEKRKLRHGDILLEISGGTKGRPVGRTIYIDDGLVKQSRYDLVYSNFCRLLRTEKGFDKYLFLYLNYIYSTGKIEQYQVQSTGIANFQFKAFLDNEILVEPPKNVLEKFNDLVGSLYSKKYYNQNAILQQTRDTLMPKLISGELSVEDTEV